MLLPVLRPGNDIAGSSSSSSSSSSGSGAVHSYVVRAWPGGFLIRPCARAGLANVVPCLHGSTQSGVVRHQVTRD